MERKRGVIKALKKRIAELENQWISVEDRLPDLNYQNVLVFCDGGGIRTTKFHSDRFAFKRLGWPKSNCYTRKLLGKLSGHFMLSHDSGYKVTHWMPLPEPPITEPRAESLYGGRK